MTWLPRDGERPADQPPHGQPYGPAGYGQYGQPYQQSPAGGTNILAILALVFAFVFAPAGVVLGHLAKRQIKATGEHGSGLATAGLVLGYVFTVIGLLACVGLILAVIAAGQSNGA
jgi:hypothetical protein